MRIRMKVISVDDASSWTVIEQEAGADPAVQGSGPHSFLCGACGTVLVEGARLGQIESAVFRCVQCRKLNAMPRVMGGDAPQG
ncbi:MAG: hypothetical protein M3N32_08575 [Actinomycetota bacterium]|nr:hypothetical protein [Actinomycetota bacterium]